MGTYGNSGGRNKGKHYVKLKGDEAPTPENEARAREFLEWYAGTEEELKRTLFPGFREEELMVETAIGIYDAIALKGRRIDNYRGYYLRAYHTARLAAKKKAGEEEARRVGIEELRRRPGRTEGAFEMQTEGVDESGEEAPGRRGDLKEEVMEFVRGRYDEGAVALFEIYVALWPEISYKRLAEMLGWPLHRIWPILGRIRREVALRFKGRYEKFRTDGE